MFGISAKLRTSIALLFLITLLTSLVGCSSPTLAPTEVPTVNVQPTLVAVQTQAVQTAIANMTKNAPTAVPATPTTAATATTAPTATTAATSTPLPPTAVPTATYVPWTLTPTQAPYSCSVTDYSPKAGVTYSPKANVDVQWVIKNTGAQKWLQQETDVRYSSGTKMQKLGDIQDLSADVASGGSYTVLIDMVTPADVGTYTASWVVITGKITICTLTTTIVVK